MDLFILIGYWLLTALAVIVEVQLTAMSAAKLLFGAVTCIYIVLLVSNHFSSGRSVNGGVTGPKILWIVGLAIIGIFLAIVMGTNLKFALGGKI
ncbi:MAG: hypothetical protein ACT4NU_09415 [Chromatiales bacterium]